MVPLQAARAHHIIQDLQFCLGPSPWARRTLQDDGLWAHCLGCVVQASKAKALELEAEAMCQPSVTAISICVVASVLGA